MKAPLLTDVDGPLGFFDHGQLFIAANGHQSDDIGTVCVDGFGFTEDFAFASGAGIGLPMKRATSYIDGCLDKINQSDLRGVFAMLRFNPHTKAFTVVTDPLSLYPLYIFTVGTLLVVSNSCYLIDVAARTLGYPVQRESRTIATRTLFDTSASLGTGYAGVIQLAHGKLVTGLGPNWRLVDAAVPAVANSANYETLLDQAAERLTNSVAAAAKCATSGNLYFDLDASPYSRLLLAAAEASGIDQPKVTFSSDDQCRSTRLVASHAGAHQVAPPSNWGNGEVPIATILKRGLYRSQALCTDFSGNNLGSMRLRGLMGLTALSAPLFQAIATPKKQRGLFWRMPIAATQKISNNDPLYGACLSGYWLGALHEKRRTSAKRAYQTAMRSAAIQTLFRPAFLRNETARIIKAFAQQSGSGIGEGLGFFMQNQSRAKLGGIARAKNLAWGALDPLCDPVLVAAEMALSPSDRYSGKLIFDLIEKLGGRQYLEPPFSSDSISRIEGKALARRLGVSEKAVIASQKSNPKLPSAELATTGHFSIAGIGDTPDNLGNLGRVLWLSKDYLRLLANAMPQDQECWNYIARDRLLRAIKHDTFFMRNESEAEIVLQLFGILMWSAGEIDPASIDTLL